VVASWAAHDNSVSRIVCDSAGGSRCVSSSLDGGLSVWELSRAQADGSNAALWSCSEAHNGAVNDCALSPFSGEAVAASVGRDGFLRLWDLRGDSQACCGLFDLGGAASCLSFSPLEPRALAVGMEDGSCALVDVRGLGSSSTIPNFTAAFGPLHQARVRRVLPVLQPRGGLYWLSASDDATVLLSQTAGGSGAVVLARHRDYVADVAVRPLDDGGGAAGGLGVYSASTDKTVQYTPIALPAD